jgi:hypothetical protein
MPRGSSQLARLPRVVHNNPHKPLKSHKNIGPFRSYNWEWLGAHEFSLGPGFSPCDTKMRYQLGSELDSWLEDNLNEA